MNRNAFRLGAGLLAWAIGGTAIADVAGEPDAAPLDHPMLGDPAPAFDLGAIDGSRVRLEDFKGRYLVVHFGASW